MTTECRQIKISQIQSIIGKMDATVYNSKYISKADINYYKHVGIVSILLTDNTVDNIQDISANIDKGLMIIVYGDNISKHDSYIFDGQVIASAFFEGADDKNDLDCTLRTGKAVDGTIMFQILYKHCCANYCVKFPATLFLEQITEYGINFTNGRRQMFVQTFAGLAYYADLYKFTLSGYIEFTRI
jgi:hypothetical protein